MPTQVELGGISFENKRQLIGHIGIITFIIIIIIFNIETVEVITTKLNLNIFASPFNYGDV